MPDKEKESNLSNIIIGIIMIILNSFWLFNYLERIWGGKLYMFMIPDWLLAVNIICALIGIFLAIRLIKRKISAWTAIPVNLLLFCICLLIETIVI